MDKNEKRKVHDKKYREKHKAERAAYAKKYYEEHKTEIKARNKKWVEDNRGRWNEYQLEYYHRKKEKK